MRFCVVVFSGLGFWAYVRFCKIRRLDTAVLAVLCPAPFSNTELDEEGAALARPLSQKAKPLRALELPGSKCASKTKDQTLPRPRAEPDQHWEGAPSRAEA